MIRHIPLYLSIVIAMWTLQACGGAGSTSETSTPPAEEESDNPPTENAESATVLIFTPDPTLMNVEGTKVDSESNLSIILLELSDPEGNTSFSKVIAQPSTNAGSEWDVLYCEPDGQWNEQGPSNNDGDPPAFEGGQLTLFGAFESADEAGNFYLSFFTQEGPLALNYTLDATLTAATDGAACN